MSESLIIGFLSCNVRNRGTLEGGQEGEKIVSCWSDLDSRYQKAEETRG